VLVAQRYVCAFFHNPEEEYRVLLPFIKDGLERGEKVFHIVDPKLRADHAYGLRQPASMWIVRKRVVSSSYATGLMLICAMATSIRIGCLL
jgi:hypothetical protein